MRIKNSGDDVKAAIRWLGVPVLKYMLSEH